MTKFKYQAVFSGSEIVVAGKLAHDNLTGVVEGHSHSGSSQYSFIPVVPTTTNTTVGFMERLWAYLTIRQLLDKKEANSDDDDEDYDSEFISNNQTVVDLALRVSITTL